MSKRPFPELPPEQLGALQARFEEIRPQIEKHGRIYFRHVRCAQRLADLTAEMVAIGWKWFVSLVLRGKDPKDFLVTFNRRLGQHVKSGRRITGNEKPDDVLSPRAQQRHSFCVQSLPSYESSEKDNEGLDALVDNTRTPPPDQAAFRIDFPAWVRRHSHRNRRIIHDLLMGERTLDVANRHGTTAGRISQLRREFCQDWNRYHGNDIAA
jgi:hypothetical protein